MVSFYVIYVTPEARFSATFTVDVYSIVQVSALSNKDVLNAVHVIGVCGGAILDDGKSIIK